MKVAISIFLVIFQLLNLSAQELKLGLKIGHTEPITSVDFSNDSRNVATASEDGTVKVWDAETGKLIHNLLVSNKPVLKCQFSSNDKYLFTSCKKQQIKVWDVESGRSLYQFEREKVDNDYNNITEFIENPAGDLLLTLLGGEIVVWDLKTGEVKFKLWKGGYSAAFSDDNRFIVTDGKTIWDAKSGLLIHDVNPMGINHLKVEPSGGPYTVESARDKTISIWDIATGKKISQLNSETLRIDKAVFSPNGKDIVTISNDFKYKDRENSIRVWNIRNGKLKSELEGEQAIKFSKSGEYFLTISKEGKAKVWDASSRKMLYGLQGKWVPNSHLVSSPDGKYIMGYGGYGVLLWEVGTQDVTKIDGVNFGIIQCAALSPDGRYVVTGSDKSAQIRSLLDGAIIHQLSGQQNEISETLLDVGSGHIITITFAEKHNYDSYSTAKIWDASSGEFIENIKMSYESYGIPEISKSGRYMAATASWYGGSEVFIRDNNTGEWLFKIGSNGTAKFTPDEEKVIFARGGQIRLWDINSQTITDSLSVKEDNRFIKVNISDNGHHILIEDYYAGAQVWDLSQKKLLVEFAYDQENKDNDRTILSPDGQKAILYDYKSVEFWDVATAKMTNSLRYDAERVIGYDGFYQYKDAINAVQFSSDGTFLISVGKAVNLYEGVNGTLIKSLIHKEKIAESAFSHDSKYVATLTTANELSVWETKSGKLISNFTSNAEITGLMFSKDGKKIITNFKDGGFGLWNAENGDFLLQHYSFGEKDWTIVRPDGLFDATPNAMREMYWTQGLSIINFEQLKDRYYEPGLWRKVMGESKEPLRKSRGLNDVKLYPELDLIHPDKNDGKLGIHLKRRSGGYGPVKIFINGKEITTDARGPEFDHKLDSVYLTYVISNHPFLKIGEINTIELIAYNAEQYLASRPKKLYFIPEGNKVEYTPTLHAIIVGSADYSGSDLDLNFPAKDATSFSKALQISAQNLLGVDQTNIKLLTTDADKDSWPSKDNIRKAFQEIGEIARPSDALVLYFAGHGTNYGGVDGDFYYLTASASNGNLKDPVVREDVAISSAELTDWIKGIPALKQILIFDACHSGQFADDLMAKRAIRSSSEVRSLERLKDRTGMYILSGSASDAVSYEASVYGQGLLTYALLFGMKGASLRDNKFVDVIQLFQFAADKVPELAADIGGIQNPEIRIPYGGESFDIGMLEAADMELIELSNPRPLYIRSSFHNQATFDDNLGLSEKLNETLKNLQSNENSLVFIDAPRFENAFSIRGHYTQKGTEIQLLANLLKDGAVIRKYDIKGTSQEQLIQRLIEAGLSEETTNNRH